MNESPWKPDVVQPSWDRTAGNAIRTSRRRFASAGRTLVLCLLVVSPASVWAGGGPENVFLVVNPRSWASVTLANHYISLRQIPPVNVHYLDWPDSVELTNVEAFRQRLLLPIQQEVQRRRLGGQIDYIVYSSDFPFGVDISADLQPGFEFPIGSLTGLTFLAPFVQEKSPQVVTAGNNLYFRRSNLKSEFAGDTHGFRFRYLWNSEGQLVDKDGMRYWLSTMLAYTSGRGTSVRSAIHSLRRSVLADGTRPLSGTVYFAQNTDIRSQLRHDWYKDTAAELIRLGLHAEVVEGTVPRGKQDIQGAVLGAALFDWPAAQNQILPGAICEHLTSFGGVLHYGATQVPMTIFQRHGAAGTSGTVAEPKALNLWTKFPHPRVQVHYLHGCSLAEAFYQSILQPYQLLILGDALCQPWAMAPQVIVKGITSGEQVRGPVQWTPEVAPENKVEVQQYEFFLDGRLLGEPRGAIAFDTATLPDGHHEIRLVGTASGDIEAQGRRLIPFTINNRNEVTVASTDPDGPIAWEGLLRVKATSPGADKIVILQNTRVVGEIEGPAGEVMIRAHQLGMGPTTLFAVGTVAGTPLRTSRSQPLPLEILEPETLPKVAVPNISQFDKGLRLVRNGGTPLTVPTTAPTDFLGIRPGDSFELDGWFQVSTSDLYQFQFALDGSVELSVDQTPLFSSEEQDYQHHYVPVSLEAGWHRLRMRGRLPRSTDFWLRFGLDELAPLTGEQFKHRG